MYSGTKIVSTNQTNAMSRAIQQQASTTTTISNMDELPLVNANDCEEYYRGHELIHCNNPSLTTLTIGTRTICAKLDSYPPHDNDWGRAG